MNQQEKSELKKILSKMEIFTEGPTFPGSITIKKIVTILRSRKAKSFPPEIIQACLTTLGNINFSDRISILEGAELEDLHETLKDRVLAP